MILVPAGEFIMGSDADEIARLDIKQELVEDEIPRHRVYLDTFYIDKYEVTNSPFAIANFLKLNFQEIG